MLPLLKLLIDQSQQYVWVINLEADELTLKRILFLKISFGISDFIS